MASTIYSDRSYVLPKQVDNPYSGLRTALTPLQKRQMFANIASNARTSARTNIDEANQSLARSGLSNSGLATFMRGNTQMNALGNAQQAMANQQMSEANNEIQRETQKAQLIDAFNQSQQQFGLNSAQFQENNFRNDQNFIEDQNRYNQATNLALEKDKIYGPIQYAAMLQNLKSNDLFMQKLTNNKNWFTDPNVSLSNPNANSFGPGRAGIMIPQANSNSLSNNTSGFNFGGADIFDAYRNALSPQSNPNQINSPRSNISQNNITYRYPQMRI